MPAIFDRNLDDDRPHLGPGLVWQSPEPRWRLARIAQFLLPYRSKDTIERGIGVTTEVLRATIDLARARGAVPVIIALQFTPEESDEHELRRRILDDAGLPYVWVQLDSAWRIPGNGHPDPRAARAIAVAIAHELPRTNELTAPIKVNGVRNRAGRAIAALVNPAADESQKTNAPRS